MTHRERVLAVLRRQRYDRLPIVHFGFWGETLHQWARVGHIPQDAAREWTDGNWADLEIGRRLGFDFNWYNCFSLHNFLRPVFDRKVVAVLPDGTQHMRNSLGVTVTLKPGAGSIPGEIDHLLKDRASWEEHYKWQLQWDPKRVEEAKVRIGPNMKVYGSNGCETLRQEERELPLGLHCGSLLGNIRNVVGMENLCYLEADDPKLLTEIINTAADLCFRCAQHVLESGIQFDFGHFWEDICFKSGPLVRPQMFAEMVGPHYRRITNLLREHGVDIVSVDCDGLLIFVMLM